MTDAEMLAQHGINVTQTYRNMTVPRLYEEAVRYDGAVITSSGALATRSGKKTGRSPNDKRIVDSPNTSGDVWWGPVNKKLTQASFKRLKQDAIADLNRCERIYVCDGYGGWDPRYQLKIRVICSRPYHALFMHNMLIRPTAAELSSFGDPEMVIYNAGAFRADPSIEGLSSDTSIALNLDTKEMVLVGTEYAGEMKKGVFSAMNFLMPRRNVLSMHCSATASTDGEVTLFFGLSGTGKTTLSADPRRSLIGDDEHCWSDEGIFNIEGGCYAKCIGLRAEQEPQIHGAIRFGTILENTVQHASTREIDFNDGSITENTRASYPIEFIDNARIPCVGGHPRHLILLTCDAFGVLPPVSKLSPAQALYHFLSGYTAKVAGTEEGINEPNATFSPCFGGAFLVSHPGRYAQLLQERMRTHRTQAWLVNTGWSGGPYGVGKRMPLAATRAIIQAIHDGNLSTDGARPDPVFGLLTPSACPGCHADLLQPRGTWSDPFAYDRAAADLAARFRENFKTFADQVGADVHAAGPT